ncbi:MAG: ATP-binding cassette domain-containing protein, partial [Candidatus Dormibacteraeota bacterium]|nr:ATP-binding cassette domain-containing protein [Candidatus Dormibacteraeota bacterium]MBO0761389.1 ATP-binding cassette domain-containing protein [Candidatus Dormibacteraeota bacterium]
MTAAPTATPTAASPDAAVPTLEVRDLRKRYRTGKVALEGVSLAARAGELTVVLGPNGCGKSTLVRCIARLIDLTSGEVRIGGVDWGG